MKRFEWLSSLVGRHELRSGVEIGVKAGDTLTYLLRKNPGLHMTGVDLWEPQPDRPAKGSGYLDFDHGTNQQRCRERVACFADRCTLLQMSSADAAERIEGLVDFVFIDADHATDAVMADIRAWRPKIRPGGFLTGHDIGWPSVRAAVDKLVPGWQPGEDGTWWVCA